MATNEEPNPWSEAEARGIEEFVNGLAEVAIQKRLRYEEATKGADKVGKALSDMLKGL
jgi:hypothetical protein